MYQMGQTITESARVMVQVRADGAKPFTAGMIVIDGTVTKTAPILRRWFLGKTADQARAIIKARGWKAVIVDGR